MPAGGTPIAGRRVGGERQICIPPIPISPTNMGTNAEGRGWYGRQAGEHPIADGFPFGRPTQASRTSSSYGPASTRSVKTTVLCRWTVVGLLAEAEISLAALVLVVVSAFLSQRALQQANGARPLDCQAICHYRQRYWQLVLAGWKLHCGCPELVNMRHVLLWRNPDNNCGLTRKQLARKSEPLAERSLSFPIRRFPMFLPDVCDNRGCH